MVVLHPDNSGIQSLDPATHPGGSMLAEGCLGLVVADGLERLLAERKYAHFDASAAGAGAHSIPRPVWALQEDQCSFRLVAPVEEAGAEAV